MTNPATTQSAKLPSTPSRAVTDASLVAPADAPTTKPLVNPLVKPPAAIDGKQTKPAPESILQPEQEKSLLKLIEEQFVQVENIHGTTSLYDWRGTCRRCGWQTHQHDEQAAFQMTRTHAQKHWRDVKRLLS